MKKKITLALCMVLMIFVLGACGKKDPADVDYNGTSYAELESQMQESIAMVQAIIDFYAQNGIAVEDVTDDVIEYLYSVGVTEAQVTAADRWSEIVQEFGSAKLEVGANAPLDTFEVTKSGKTLTTDLILEFEKKDVNFQVVYDYNSMEITGISIEPVYTIGEKMQKAGINTLLSITIVFLVLILISLLIACFNIFPYLEKRKAEKNDAPVQEHAVPVPAVAQKTVQQTDDSELIAVIAAAIAANTGASTNDFVVRSIKRRS